MRKTWGVGRPPWEVVTIILERDGGDLGWSHSCGHAGLGNWPSVGGAALRRGREIFRVVVQVAGAG